jgi:hypothetical protein
MRPRARTPHARRGQPHRRDPLLIEEVRRRAPAQPTTFALLIPTAAARKEADWTLDRAVALLERAAGGRVDGLGYVREGVMRSVHFRGGRRIDAELWSRLPSDPAPRR